MAGLTRALAVPKEEIDRREQAWREQEQEHKSKGVKNPMGPGSE